MSPIAEPEPEVAPVRFVLCAERGTLTRKALLLVDSLRAFGGRYADAEVLAYAPRPDRVPGRRNLDRLAERGVEVVTSPLNRSWPAYGFANKIVACADAERRGGDVRIVFLDSDMVVLREPSALASADAAVVRLRPVEQRGAGSSGSDEHAHYWHRLHTWAGIGVPHFVRTTLSGERIYAYWNAGVISAAASAGFFDRWKEVFAKLVREGLVHPAGMTFMDQIALAVTAQTAGVVVEELPPAYNLPVLDRAQAMRVEPGSAVLVHYHRLLDYRPRRSPLTRLAEPAQRARLDAMTRAAGLAGAGAFWSFRVGWRLARLSGRRAE